MEHEILTEAARVLRHGVRLSAGAGLRQKAIKVHGLPPCPFRVHERELGTGVLIAQCTYRSQRRLVRGAVVLGASDQHDLSEGSKGEVSGDGQAKVVDGVALQKQRASLQMARPGRAPPGSVQSLQGRSGMGMPAATADTEAHIPHGDDRPCFQHRLLSDPIHSGHCECYHAWLSAQLRAECLCIAHLEPHSLRTAVGAEAVQQLREDEAQGPEHGPTGVDELVRLVPARRTPQRTRETTAENPWQAHQNIVIRANISPGFRMAVLRQRTVTRGATLPITEVHY